MTSHLISSPKAWCYACHTDHRWGTPCWAPAQKVCDRCGTIFIREGARRYCSDVCRYAGRHKGDVDD